MTANRCYRDGLCPFEVIAMFEKEGLTQFNPKYILTFLDHIANTYINNEVLLSDGSSGKIVLINKKLTRPTIQLDNGTSLIWRVVWICMSRLLSNNMNERGAQWQRKTSSTT